MHSQPDPVALDVGLLEGLWDAYCSSGGDGGGAEEEGMGTRGLTTLWRHFTVAFEYSFAPVPSAASRCLIDALNGHAHAGER
jgi:hypothetical protein